MEKYYVTVGSGKYTQNVYKRDGGVYKFSSEKQPMMLDRNTARLICTKLIVTGFDAKVYKIK